MNILLLGGSGFIGTNLVINLLDSKEKIYIYDKVKNHVLDNLQKIGKIKYFYKNFILEREFEKYLENIDCVIHFIHTTTPNENINSITEEINSNLIPTIRLLNSIKKMKIKKLIFISSGGTIYGYKKGLYSIKENSITNPICSYGIIKLAIEKYLNIFFENSKTNFIIIRPSNPFGVNYSSENSAIGLINIALLKIKNNEVLNIWGDGNNIRDYIYITDLVNAIIKAIYLNTNQNHIFNISTGFGISINNLLKLVEKVTQKVIEINYLPKRSCDVNFNVLDNSKAKKILNWEPKINIEQGIKITWEWLNKIKNYE